MPRPFLLVMHRYAANGLRDAILCAMTYLGRMDTVWIVRDSRHDAYCVCQTAPYGQFKVPQCTYRLRFDDVNGPDYGNECLILFGPATIPEEEYEPCQVGKN